MRHTKTTVIYCYKTWRLNLGLLELFSPTTGQVLLLGSGGRDSHIKMRGYSSETFENTLKCTRISFDGRGSNKFLPLRSTNFKTTHVLFCPII